MDKIHEQLVNEESNNGKMPIYFYFLGLSMAIIGLLINGRNPLLQNILFSIATITAGYYIIIVEGLTETIQQSKENGKFTPNAHILMGLAAVGASLIGNFWEGTLLILIFAGANFLEEYAQGKSEKEIINLIKMNPTTASLIMPNGKTKTIKAEDIRIGDKLQVLNGDQVPIDGIILSGRTSIDESAITGESIPKEKTKGDRVFGSTINGTGTFSMEVTKEKKDTIFSKILELVNQNQDNQTKATSLIQKFEPKYVSSVLIIIPLIILTGPYLFNWPWEESIYRGLTLLVVASPCALAASTISATLSATSNLAKKGVLSKGSAYLSQFADIKAIAFDKTRTLTLGKPEVTHYYFEDSVDFEHIIDIIVALERKSNHPLADAILEKFTPKNKLDIKVVNQIGKGLRGDYEGETYRIGKPTSFKGVSDEYMNIDREWGSQGNTVVYVGKNEKDYMAKYYLFNADCSFFSCS